VTRAVFKVGVTTRDFIPAEPYDWRGAKTHARVVLRAGCGDPDGTDRDAVHVETIRLALDFFTANLRRASAANCKSLHLTMRTSSALFHYLIDMGREPSAEPDIGARLAESEGTISLTVGSLCGDEVVTA